MTSTKSDLGLTSGRLLAKNTAWNLAGQLLPMLVALITIPLLVRGLGLPRFGVLSIGWVVIGYFSLFDLGIGRALTQVVAQKLGAGEEASIPSLFWASLFLLFLLGLAASVFTCAISPWLVHKALKVPLDLQPETLPAFYLLALSIPTVTVTAGLRGLLEALQKFRILNLIRIPMSVYSFASPLVVLPFSRSLVPVIGVLVGGRIIGLAAHLLVCFTVMPALRRKPAIEYSLMPLLVKTGSWMTVSNLLGPALIYSDRFVIGAVLSVSAVGYYTAPVDMLTRLWIIPAAFAGVLFPAFATTLVQEPGRAGLLLLRGTKYVFIILFPLLLGVVAFAPEILQAWLGANFAQNGTGVLRWVATGMLMSCLAQLPFSMIQSAGRADVTAKLVLLELLPYVALTWYLTSLMGVTGAAVAWAGRVTLEGVFLFFYSVRLLPQRPKFLGKLAIAMAASMALLYLAMVPEQPLVRGIVFAITVVAFGLASWWWGLKHSERSFLMGAASRASAKISTN